MGKRITSKFKPQNRWVRDMVESDPQIGSTLDVTNEMLQLQTPSKSLCSVCKGGKMLCGKTTCPIMARLGAYNTMFQGVKGTEIDGSSPPSVFVGRFGYPYVQIGHWLQPSSGTQRYWMHPSSGSVRASTRL